MLDEPKLDLEFVARKIAISRINKHNAGLEFPANTYTARLPILQEGIHAKAPYFEVSGISGVSLRRPSQEDYESAKRCIKFRMSPEFGTDNR